MAPTLEQSTANSIAKYQGRTVTATFTRRTTPGNLIVVMVAASGTLPSNLTTPSGFTLISNRGLRDMQMSVYYRQGATGINSVSVTSLDADKSMQIRAMEYSGIAQASALDKTAIASNESSNFSTGSTGTTSQGDELVLGFIANQYASTTQYGFSGGMVRLYEGVSPQSPPGFLGAIFGYNQDWERSRYTVHQAVTTTTGNYTLAGQLSTSRRWLGTLVTFKGASSGPARFTSTTQDNTVNTGGTGSLTVFGPLVSSTQAPPMVVTGSTQARVGPFNYQYRLGGWTGLLIGDGTPYNIISHDGLEGWDIRTSDDDLPRGDGALRGVDLQASRQILFELQVGADGDGTTALVIQSEVENLMDTLYRNLVPQRDQDWELIWRHPGRPLRMVRVRPTNLTRELTWEQTVINQQKFALIASDPRHYSAFVRTANVTVTPASGVITPVTLINAGNGAAYPLVRIQGPTSGPPVTRIELNNLTADVSFVVEAILPGNSVLIGDMEARATGAARSVVTIDGQSKYGAWQHPRDTFRLGPGGNDVHIVTEPPGAPIVTTLEYRDTWSG